MTGERRCLREMPCPDSLLATAAVRTVLNAAPSLETLRAMPSNRLEALGGNRKGQYSIRINRQWRICFEWPEWQSGPSSVEIVDYHS